MENCHCSHCEEVGQDIMRLTTSTDDIQTHLYELTYKIKRLITRRSLKICPQSDLPSIEGFNAMQTMEREFRQDGEDLILARQEENKEDPSSDPLKNEHETQADREATL